MLAAGVSYGDVLARIGAVPDAPKPPFTPGFDITGVVDKLGAGVTSLQLGMRVAALLDRGGGDAAHVCLPVDAKLEAGQRILVHGAAGGVGSALLQLAARHGLDSYGTASLASTARVRDQRAVPIDYRNEDFLARVRDLPGGGVDAAFDAIGGGHFLRSLRAGGHLVAFGVSRSVRNGRRNRPTAIVSFLAVRLLGLFPTGRAATFYTAGSLERTQPLAYREDLSEVLRLLGTGEIQPLVGETFPLARGGRSKTTGSPRSSAGGKIVLTGSEA